MAVCTKDAGIDALQVCEHVCEYVWECVCLFACVGVCLFVCAPTCLPARVFGCVHAFACAYMWVCTLVSSSGHTVCPWMNVFILRWQHHILRLMEFLSPCIWSFQHSLMFWLVMLPSQGLFLKTFILTNGTPQIQGERNSINLRVLFADHTTTVGESGRQIAVCRGAIPA